MCMYILNVIYYIKLRSHKHFHSARAMYLFIQENENIESAQWQGAASSNITLNA